MRTVSQDALKKGDRVRILGPVDAFYNGTRALSKKESDVRLTEQAKADGARVKVVQLELVDPQFGNELFAVVDDEDLPPVDRTVNTARNKEVNTKKKSSRKKTTKKRGKK